MDLLTTREKLTKEFAELVVKLEPIEFMGICQILRVPLQRGAADPTQAETEELKDFYELYSDMIEVFAGLQKKVQRELLQVMRAAAKKKSDGDKEVVDK